MVRLTVVTLAKETDRKRKNKNLAEEILKRIGEPSIPLSEANPVVYAKVQALLEKHRKQAFHR